MNKKTIFLYYFCKSYKRNFFYCKIFITKCNIYLTYCIKYITIFLGGVNLKNIKLKMARIEKDLSQEDLANLVGVTRQTIGLIEAGKYNPSLKLCIAICKALNKTLDDLFWQEEEDDEEE